MNWTALIAGAVGLAIGGSAVALSGAGSRRAEIEDVVRDYLLANPEIVTEAQVRLQDREVAKLVEANRALFETPYAGAWAGAADGDVVLVEFFDYGCGYCRRSNADVDRLLAEDKKLKVVWREYPILSRDSLAAAELSLAAAEQGKFRPFFDGLFAQGRPTEPARAATQRSVGVAAPASDPRHRAEIEKNYELARLIGASGTPAFVIGNQVLRGAVGYESLKAAITQSRSRKTTDRS